MTIVLQKSSDFSVLEVLSVRDAELLQKTLTITQV